MWVSIKQRCRGNGGTVADPQLEAGAGVVDNACDREGVVDVESPKPMQSRSKLKKKVKPFAQRGKGAAEELRRRTL